MVTIVSIVLAILSTQPNANPEQPPTPRFSLQMLHATGLAIMPCEPVFLAMQIDTDDESRTEAIGEAIASETAINGKRLAWTFRPEFVGVSRIDGSLRASVILFWDFADKSCLFDAPGSYKVTVGPDIKLTVVVEQPSADDVRALGRLKHLPTPFPMLVLGGTTYDTDTLSAAEEIIRNYPQSRHARWLAMNVGSQKLNRVLATPEVSREEFLRQRLMLAKTYIEPHCTGEIRLPNEAVAAFKLAYTLLDSEEFETQSGRSGSAPDRSLSRRLFEAVAAYPFSHEYATKAQRGLAKLDELDVKIPAKRSDDGR